MAAPPILSVSQVTRQIKETVEGNFPLVYVVGEISNFSRAGSGHIYLTLKDESANLRAVVWRNTATRLRFELHDGLEVIAAGPIEVYEARGTYQLVVEQLAPKGLGALELAFRQLCAKLEAEGLFAATRKRPLPRYPRRVALVTSPSGAAVRDMLQVITRRWPGTNVLVVPVAVQGEGAAEQIAQALRSVHLLSEVDVVIAGRGGGSLEDLWAFNTEIVARAIFECRLPVVSAVGHEIDVTVADLVADRRALTPSEAGELVVPHRDDVRGVLAGFERRLAQALARQAWSARTRLEGLASRRVLARPRERLHESSQRLDDWEARLRRAVSLGLERNRQQIAAVSGRLDALSPLKVLDRGYSVTRRVATGEVLRSTAGLSAGDEVETRLAQGSFVSRVEEPASNV
ncbi:MAG: exodeoxyribonuclease VII large subunit [Planctomycetaceae bacterium]